MLDNRDRYGVRSVYRPLEMPEPNPSVPVSTRSMASAPPCSWAWSLPGRSGALAVWIFTLVMMSGWSLVKLSNMPCVSWALPATSTMLSWTGLLGLSGTSLDAEAPPPPPPVLGAVQAAASAAAEIAASSPMYRRLRGSPVGRNSPFPERPAGADRPRVGVGTRGTRRRRRRAHHV